MPIDIFVHIYIDLGCIQAYKTYLLKLLLITTQAILCVHTVQL